MNGPRVVPLLLALWLPFAMPERARRAWDRLRRALGLVHEPCDRLHADEVDVVIECLVHDNWQPVEDANVYERHLIERWTGGPWDALAAVPVRVRAYGPGHPRRRPDPAFDCEGVGGGWRG